MAKNLIFIDTSIDKARINDIPDARIFSFSLIANEFLERKNMEFNIADKFLSEIERDRIFVHVTKCHRWYYETRLNEKFEYRGVNLLNSSDSVEFFSYFIVEAIKFFTIKNIIKKEKPKKIFADITMFNIIKHVIKKENIIVEFFGEKKNQELLWDKITIKQNLGKIPISFTISRKSFLRIKKVLESIVCSTCNLWIDPIKSKKDSILFLEFNPSEYQALFSNLDDKKNIILVNRRRPAIWSINSIKTMIKNNCKLINFNDFISKEERDQLPNIIEDYKKSLELELSTTPKAFLFLDDDLWPIIKNTIIERYQLRIPEYIFFLTAMKNFFEKNDVSSIIMLNQLGETEKTLLEINRNERSSILLEHAFANYTKETSRFSILSSHSILDDKIAVWGEIQKKYLIEFHDISPERIFVIGSPRHDKFFQKIEKKKIEKKKRVLIAPHPITEITGQFNTELYLKYEETVKIVCDILDKMNEVEIIVKLHPSQLEHNKLLENIFKEIDSSIPVHFSTPTNELIDNVDTVLTISPEGMDPSTIILESLILEKPTMNIILDNHFYDYEVSRSNAIISVMGTSNIEEEMRDIIFNEKKRLYLIDNGKRFINEYLSNHGVASESFAEMINKF